MDGPLPTGDGDLDVVLERNWQAIMSKLRKQNVVETLNVQLLDEDPETVTIEAAGETYRRLLGVWGTIRFRTKINCSFGVALRNRVTGEIRYFHSSPNNALVFPGPRLIRNEADLRQLFADIADTDIGESAMARHPNTQWVLRTITNVTFFIYKILDMGKIGGTEEIFLPTHIMRNKAVVALLKDSAGRYYRDSLCVF